MGHGARGTGQKIYSNFLVGATRWVALQPGGRPTGSPLHQDGNRYTSTDHGSRTTDTLLCEGSASSCDYLWIVVVSQLKTFAYEHLVDLIAY